MCSNLVTISLIVGVIEVCVKTTDDAVSHVYKLPYIDKNENVVFEMSSILPRPL